MKINYVLIDYENVQPALADALAQPVFKVWVFVGAQQTKVKIDLLELLQRKGVDARFVKMTSSGRNALDFHMAIYAGELVAQDPQAYLHIVSKDTGLDPLIQHLKSRGIEATRWPEVFDIPIVKVPAVLSDDERLSRIVEYLVRRGHQRPASLRTLLGSVSALFEPRLTEAQAAALLEPLQANGVFQVVGSRIEYGLPD